MKKKIRKLQVWGGGGGGVLSLSEAQLYKPHVVI